MSRNVKKEVFIAVINCFIFCVTIALIMFAMKYSRQSATNRYVEDITDKCENYYGKTIELDKIFEKEKVISGKNDEKFYASYKLKRKVNKKYTLVFRASNCFVNVYVDGKLASEDDKEQNKIFGRSPGHRWHMVSISSDKKICNISFELESAYRDGNGGIDNVYIGAPLGVVKQVLRDRITGFIISVVLCILGLILCSLYMFVRKKQRRKDDKILVNKIVLDIGILTLFMGVFSSIETYFWQFFIGKSHFFQLMSYIFIFLITVTIGIIGREVSRERRKKYKDIIYFFGGVIFVIATILNFTGICEYYYIMRVVYVYCAMLSILIFIEGYNYIKNQEYISKLLLFGVSFFSVTFACDCLRYLSGIEDDICAYSRVGFLAFIICILIESCSKAINTMQQGVLADLYKRMADTDTLTTLNNRNALLFDECKYNELIRNNKEVAMVMFDVNDLKYVNDTYGHNKGDILIKTAAAIIHETFGDIGKCYRTGGDEFVAVIVSEESEILYKKAIKKFLEAVRKHNKENSKEINLEVAYGVYISNEENVSVMWHKADELMYKKKKEMKNIKENKLRKESNSKE